MSSPEHISVLVRAFKAAWEFYFRPDRDTPVLECLATPTLAQFLVNKRNEGMTDEPSLAAAGLEFLFSLEDQHFEFLLSLEDQPEDVVDDTADDQDFSWNVLHLENAAARFIPAYRVGLKRRSLTRNPNSFSPQLDHPRAA